MARIRKTVAIAGVILGAISSAANAAIIVDKAPNLTPAYQPLYPGTSYVYTNSFVFTTGATGSTMTKVGIYLRNIDTSLSGGGVPFFFEVYGDNGNAPDPTNVLGTTGTQQFNGGNIMLVTDLLAPLALTNGARYWIAASVVGQVVDPDTAGYQVGGHAQNSVYNDNGTFWNANDAAGQVFSISPTPTIEMAIYAEGNLIPIVGAVPEPASLTIWGLGLLGCSVAVRRRRKLAA